MVTPVLVVQLYLGPDDGDEVPTRQGLPRVIQAAPGHPGEYVRDASLDLVRADGTPVHRYRWTDSRPPPQADA